MASRSARWLAWAGALSLALAATRVPPGPQWVDADCVVADLAPALATLHEDMKTLAVGKVRKFGGVAGMMAKIYDDVATLLREPVRVLRDPGFANSELRHTSDLFYCARMRLYEPPMNGLRGADPATPREDAPLHLALMGEIREHMGFTGAAPAPQASRPRGALSVGHIFLFDIQFAFRSAHFILKSKFNTAMIAKAVRPWTQSVCDAIESDRYDVVTMHFSARSGFKTLRLFQLTCSPRAWRKIVVLTPEGSEPAQVDPALPVVVVPWIVPEMIMDWGIDADELLRGKELSVFGISSCDAKQSYGRRIRKAVFLAFIDYEKLHKSRGLAMDVQCLGLGTRRFVRSEGFTQLYYTQQLKRTTVQLCPSGDTTSTTKLVEAIYALAIPLRFEDHSHELFLTRTLDFSGLPMLDHRREDLVDATLDLIQSDARAIQEKVRSLRDAMTARGTDNYRFVNLVFDEAAASVRERD